MEIFICTYGRSDKQITHKNLPDDILEKTKLVIQEREQHKYPNYVEAVILPPHIQTIGATRQYLVENFGPFICMLDDDLDFATRRVDEPTKFLASTENEIRGLFSLIEQSLLEGYPLVGVASREGGNFNTDDFLYCTRQMRVHGVNTFKFRELGIRYDRLELMEDFDVILQLLEKGEQNCVINGFVTNQRGSNTSGGCSEYRTPEAQEVAANMLKELHPGIVQVVRKYTKTAWGGGWRHDVRVAWKRAYKNGR